MGDVTINEESSNASSSSSSQISDLLRKDGPNIYSSKKQASVGSLSYTVTDTTSSNQTQELSTNAVSSNADNSQQKLSEQKTSVNKPTPRAKVPFEKGYSQMDWLKLTRSHPDLAGSLTEILHCNYTFGCLEDFLNNTWCFARKIIIKKS